MPELPEVETVRRSLEPLLLGRKIAAVHIHYGGIIKKPSPKEFVNALKGLTIESVGRRGKYLLVELRSCQTLVIHLRMTGQLTVVEQKVPLPTHTHLVFVLDNGTELRFNDVRKFGLVYLIAKDCFHEAGGLSNLGPEPLEKEFTLEYLKTRLQGKKGKLKSFLLDQTQIAGIGNIYADEAMFRAGLHPERVTASLTLAEITRLHQAIQMTLQEGINFRGTSIKDYVDGKGEKGGFQERLKVYGRAGKSCDCGCSLEKKTVAGRTTVYCPRCQG